MNDDIPPTPKPAVILDSMRAELIRMRKVVEEADKLRPKIKRAERFIKNFAETWSLPVPEETRIVVPTKPKPVGIRVDDPDLECPKCPFEAAGPTGLASHTRLQHGIDFAEVRRLQAARRTEGMA